MERLGEFIACSGKSKTKSLEEITSVAQYILATEISVTKQEWTVVQLNNDKRSSEHLIHLRKEVCSLPGGQLHNSDWLAA